MFVRFGFRPVLFRKVITSASNFVSRSRTTKRYGPASGNASCNCCSTQSRLRSYSAAIRTVFANVTYIVDRYANNRARSLPSADPPTGTANAPIQIRSARATVSLAPRCRPESIPSGPALTEIEQSPAVAIAILRSLADSYHGLSHSQKAQNSWPQMRLDHSS